MSENVYEGLFILNSELYARTPDEISGQMAIFIEKTGGEVLLSRLWDERRLAYPIKGHKRATYWLTYFKIDPAKVKDLTRQFQITDSILRHMFLKLDPRIVDAVVEHAKEGPIKPQAPEDALNTEISVVEMGSEIDEDVIEPGTV
ncbi:MAG: 30S ribosomal protein S6 [Planctomycetaceae bacterium]|nr:30S ribosomal protein S6 [Planctomycetaceae bacterium]